MASRCPFDGSQYRPGPIPFSIFGGNRFFSSSIPGPGNSAGLQNRRREAVPPTARQPRNQRKTGARSRRNPGPQASARTRRGCVEAAHAPSEPRARYAKRGTAARPPDRASGTIRGPGVEACSFELLFERIVAAHIPAAGHWINAKLSGYGWLLLEQPLYFTVHSLRC